MGLKSHRGSTFVLLVQCFFSMHRTFTYLFFGILVSHFWCAPARPAKQKEWSRYVEKQSSYPFRVLHPHSKVPECSPGQAFHFQDSPSWQCLQMFSRACRWKFSSPSAALVFGGQWRPLGGGRRPHLVCEEPCPRRFLPSPVSGINWSSFFFSFLFLPVFSF